MSYFLAQDGKVAIYTGDDDAPFSNPLGNLPRVLFHSDLQYPAIVSERSGTLSLPGRGGNSIGWAAHNLFAHGRTGTPLVLGYVVIGGLRQRIAGSVPIQGNSRGWARWLSVGADTTNVKMAEFWAAGGSGGGAYGAISLAWRVFVLETTFEATPELTDEAVYIDPTDFRAGRGKFDARKRYLRNGNTLQNFPIARGRTCVIGTAQPSNFPMVTLTFALAGQSFATNFSFSPAPGQNVTVSGPSYGGPSYSLVTT
jgi:hypothetical protein